MCCFVLALLAEADFVDERVAVVHNRHTVVPVPHIELDTPARTTVRRSTAAQWPCAYQQDCELYCDWVALPPCSAAWLRCAADGCSTAGYRTAGDAMRCDATL